MLSNIIVIPLPLLLTFLPQLRCLFRGGAYSSNYCNWQLKSLLHLAQIVRTFMTLLHLGWFITFRPSARVRPIISRWLHTPSLNPVSTFLHVVQVVPNLNPKTIDKKRR